MENTKTTPDNRKEQFVKEYLELVKKYDIELLAVPQYVPSGQNGFNTSAFVVPIDKKAQNIPSPIQQKDIIQ